MKILDDHPYHEKTDFELRFIVRDAGEAAKNMHEIGNEQAENKYMDQLNDAATILYWRNQYRRMK